MNRDTGRENRLDNIRRTQGADACREFYRKLTVSDRKAAAVLVNDNRLRFGTLFLLSQALQDSGMAESLNVRNQTALKLCSHILLGKGKEESEKISYEDPNTRTVLLWMFQTGRTDDGLNNDFDEVLDISASLLLRYYHEKSILPAAADLLFERHKKGTYRHDIAWVLFHSHDPSVLKLVSERLLSDDERDAGLARTLLNLPDPGNSPAERKKQYDSFQKWVRENGPYLYFTGESFNRTNHPNACGVDLEAKYLCKSISPHSRSPLAPWNEAETTCRNCFRGASEDDRKLLAAFSRRMHERNPVFWHRWIRLPLEEQIRIASGNRGADR